MTSPSTFDIQSDKISIITTTSLETYDSGSSATTVWGPGTLSGRAIKTLGEASLRGVEKLIVRWKLAKINSSLPQKNANSHSTPSLEKTEKIYDDLLELSRYVVIPWAPFHLTDIR